MPHWETQLDEVNGMVEVEFGCSVRSVGKSRGIILEDSWALVAFSASIVGSLCKAPGVQGRGCCGRGVREGIGLGRGFRMSTGSGGGGSIGERRRRTVRVRRKYTSRAKGWEWKGRRRAVGGVGWWEEVGVMKAIGGIWRKYRGLLRGGEGGWVIQGLVGLGRGLFEKVVGFIDRVVNPDLETELIIEYGIVPPSPGDKYFVDPLKDWDLTKVTYYKDSFGRNVYLQADSRSMLIAATDFRDLYSEIDTEECEKFEEKDSSAPVDA